MTLALLLAPAASAAPGDVTGVWLGHDRDGHVEIKPCGKFLCGYIISILDKTIPANPRDIYNEKTELRTRPICDLQVLGELKNQGDSWGDGWVYDPRTGKSYSAEIKLNNPNTLELRGYIGIKFMGETRIWTRASKNIPRCVRARPQ